MSLFEDKYSLRREMAWIPVFEGHSIEDLHSKPSCVSGNNRGNHDCAGSGLRGHFRSPGSKVLAAPSPRGPWRIQEALWQHWGWIGLGMPTVVPQLSGWPRH